MTTFAGSAPEGVGSPCGYPKKLPRMSRVLRALVLDHDGDVLEAAGDLLGKRVERGSNVLLELLRLHQ